MKTAPPMSRDVIQADGRGAVFGYTCFVDVTDRPR